METKKLNESTAVSSIKDTEFILGVMGDGSINKISLLNALATPISCLGSKYYITPTPVLTVNKPDVGDMTVTITLSKCVTGTRNDCFKIFTIGTGSNSRSGYVDFIKSSAGSISDRFGASFVGDFRNVRLIRVEGELFVGADFLVHQFGCNVFHITGLCHNISDIKNVTGMFSEVV